MAKLWLYQQSAGPVAPISATPTQTVVLNRFDNSSTVYNPTVVPGDVSIVLDQIASTTTVYNPTVVQAGGAQTVTLNLFTNTSTVYNPTVLAGALSVVLDRLESTTTVYNPTVVAGAVTISLNQTASTTTVYNPTVIQPGALQTITLDLFGSTTQIFLPTVQAISAITDTSDILDRYRKRRSESKEEEEIAAQLLKARQQKPKLEKEQKALVSWKNLLYKAINGAQSIEELEAIEIPVAPVESTKLAILATEELQLAKERKRAQFISSLTPLETIAVKHEQAIRAAEQAQQQAFQQLQEAEQKALEFTTKRNNRIKRLKALMWLAKLDL